MSLILPSARVSRADTLFLFRASDCIDDEGVFARSYGQKVRGVFTRGSRKSVLDQGRMLSRIANGAPPLSWVNGEPTLYMEAAGTPLVTRSDDFAHSAWTKVRATPIAAPEYKAYFLQETAGNGSHYMWHLISYAAGAVLTHSVEVRPATRTVVTVRVASNSGSNGFYVIADLAAGVITTSQSFGTGAIVGSYIEGPSADGFFRVSVAGTVDPAATTGSAEVGLVSGSTVYAGDGSSGVWVRRDQAEEARAPSSVMLTNGSATVRAADQLYFPFNAPPQEMSLYVRGYEMTARPWDLFGSMSQRLMQITGGTDTGARILLYKPGATNSYRVFYSNDGSASVSSSVDITPVRGDLIEVRGVLSAAGVVQVAAAKSGGAQTVGGASAALALPSAWSGQRLHVGSMGAGGSGMFATTHIVAAVGNRSSDDLRAIAGI